MNSLYQHKPIKVEAVCFTPETILFCQDWLGPKRLFKTPMHEGIKMSDPEPSHFFYVVRHPRGRQEIFFGDYIVKDLNGHFYVVDGEVFKKCYEEESNDVNNN